MNYEKMWYVLKERLLKETGHKELGPGRVDAADQHLKLMADIEIKATKEAQDECGCCGCSDSGQKAPEEKHSNIGPGSCPDDTQEKEKTGKDILKDIFGDGFVDDVATLAKKLKGSKEKVIMIDADLEVPEHLEREAKDRKIVLARAQCGTFKVGADAPFPMPFPFPPGFLK